MAGGKPIVHFCLITELRVEILPILNLHTNRPILCVHSAALAPNCASKQDRGIKNPSTIAGRSELVTRAERLSRLRVYEYPMRIRTDGKFAYREDLVDDAADLLGENTRVGAVKASTEFTRQMLPALERAVEHPDMTPELAEILSTGVVDVEYQVSTGVSVE